MDRSSIPSNNNKKEISITINNSQSPTITKTTLSPGKGQLDPEVIGFRATSESYPMSDIFIVDDWFPLGMRTPKLPIALPKSLLGYFARFLGVARFRWLKPREKKFVPPPFILLLTAFVSAFISIAIMILISQYTHVDGKVLNPVGSTGATMVLLAALGHTPGGQPKNIIGGNLIGACVGMIFSHIIPAEFDWISGALSVSLTIVLMQVTDTLHPPAGATALIAVLSKVSWWYPLAPILFCNAIQIVVNLIVQNVFYYYPERWGDFF